MTTAVPTRELVHLDIREIIVGGRSRKQFGDVQGLADSIAALGLLAPVVADASHRLISGERRLRAVKSLGWATVACIIAADLVEAADLLRAELEENTCRLALAPSEAVAHADRIAALHRPQAEAAKAAGQRNGGKARQSSLRAICPQAENEKPIRTADVAAQSVGMSRRTLEKATAIVASGDERLVEEMDRTGKVDRVFKRLKSARQRAADQAVAATLTTDCGIALGDFRTAGDVIADGSVSVVFTDPPYIDESIALYSDLVDFAARVLRPGGWLLAYSGQAHYPAIMAAMSGRGLEYGWTFAALHSGGDTFFRKFALWNTWKPILGWYKPPLAATWEPLRDSTSGGREKGLHPWQQAQGEAEHFIGAMTVPGSLVVDPFAGSGTTLAAAKRLGRKWWGCEIDAGHCASARARLAADEVPAAAGGGA